MAKDSKNVAVPIGAVKGRPMLQWVGKKPITEIPTLPAQHVEQFVAGGGDPTDESSKLWAEWPAAYPHSGLLFHGDNKEVLSHLVANGFRRKVQLVYIDPPFDSGADYVRKVKLRGPGVSQMDGMGYSLGEQVQYTDIWANDNYLQFMYERLILIKELLADNSNFVLHCDWRKSHHLRTICDEVFGPEAFSNEVYWYFYNKMHDSRKGQLPRATNTLLIYRFGQAPWHDVDVPRASPVRQLKRVKVDGVLKNLRDEDGALVYQETDSKTIDNVWPIPLIPPADKTQKTDYPTQKPRALLDLILRTYSNEGGIVLDCFAGSGTTAESAQVLGRRWIAADINKGAIHTTAKRVRAVFARQSSTEKGGVLEGQGFEAPVQLRYDVFRVNDYDLHVNRVEAIQLACDHLGIQRSKTDSFFEGTLGKKLAKIASFEHPLSAADVQEVQNEIELRAEEDRDLVLVCLDSESGALAHIEDWNRLRKVRGAPNRMSVIELRTDPKYGGFLRHDPPEAQVAVRRDGENVVIEIEDFVSPGIVNRLSGYAATGPGAMDAELEDWRWMVDYVQIDTNYDGSVINVALSDTPARREDLVDGTYVLPVGPEPARVAVSITDMLGGEVMQVHEV